MRADNAEVADVLERVADLLEAQHADGFRVRAYRRGAAALRTLDRPVADLVESGGEKALLALPHIGKSLAAAIAEYVCTGRLGLLDRLEGAAAPEDLFATVPGIGEELSHRIHETLGVQSLEELEAAAHDGRLAQVPGFGPRRVRAVRDSLASVLARSVRGRVRRLRGRERAREAGAPPVPRVEAVLAVDALYRRRAEAGTLRKIAPRRFNPAGEAWLPVLHTARDGWYFTALFSNTARAHRLGTIHDWVVVFYERDGIEGQCTVVTEHAGPLTGRRVVRGREAECSAAPAAPLDDGGAGDRPVERRA